MLQLLNNFEYAIRLSVEACSSLASVERMQEYTQLPEEPPDTLATDPPPAAWPLEGSLEVRDLALRHRPDLPLAVKEFSLRVSPGLKVGIVGRTGAGKSSLLQALFRLVEPESG